MNNLFTIPPIELQMEGMEEWENELRNLAGRDHPERFCTVSLGDWLDLCRKAEVPFVPANQVAVFQLQDCLTFDRPGEHQDRLAAVFQELEAAKRDRNMFRMDPASSAQVKYHLSQGEAEYRPEFQDIVLGDPRLFDILFEYPRDEVPVWQRPWVDALTHEGYPVEYRVYVQDGTIQGISNYYPQRPLPDTDEVKRQVRRAKELTERLLKHLTPPFLWPTTTMLHGSPLNLKGVHSTMDFLVDAKGETLFLEGGPPHELGAHPCCFTPGETRGIALSDRNQPEE